MTGTAPARTDYGPPLQLFVEMTSACNLRCPHCYVAAGAERPKQIPPRMLHEMLGEFQASGGRWISLSGGEPTLHEGWRAATRYARYLGLDVVLITNGTSLTPDDIQFVADVGSRVAVSLDGATARTHDAIRGSGSYARTLPAVSALVAAGVDVTICFTPMARNYHDLAPVIALAERLGVPTVYVSLLEARGRALDGGDLALPEEAKRAVIFAILSLQERYPDVSVNCLNLKYFTERLHGAVLDADGLDRTLRVTASADVYLTAYLDDDPFYLGKYEPGQLERMWTSDKVERAFQQVRTRETSIAACQTCEAWRWCKGGSAAFAWTSSGSFEGVDSYCTAKRHVFRSLLGGAV